MSKQNKKIFHPENEPSSFDQEGALLKFWRENQRITVRDVMTEDELFLCLLNVSQQKTGNAFPIFRTFPHPVLPCTLPTSAGLLCLPGLGLNLFPGKKTDKDAVYFITVKQTCWGSHKLESDKKAAIIRP